MYSKRRSDYLDLNYPVEEEEEEDEWEKEVLTSSADYHSNAIQNKRPIQPNQYPIHIDILSNQHQVLIETHQQLVEQLAELQLDLEKVKKEEVSLKEKLTCMQQEYIKAIEETVSSIDRSSFIEPQNNRYTLAVSDDTKYIESDRLLSMELNRVVTQWQEILKSDPIEDRDGRKTLAYDFKRNEFDIMDLIAQIKGFEARIQFLNRDRAKLNGLPQILPILKSETENYTSDMKAATLQLEKLEKDTIRPSLDALAELKIIWPLQEDHYRKELNILEKLLDDMDKVYKTSVKQRACQQLVSYIYDLNQQGDIDRHKTMEFLVNKLELDIARINEEKEDIKTLTMEDKDKMYLEMIGLFLDDFFRQHDLENDAKELSLIEKIVKLKSYETELKQRWNEDFESCMDAAKELHKLQERLFSSLYSHSSDNHFIMTPRSYTTLQEQLEYKTQELTAELSNLENDINNEEENHVWEQEKKLFSVFFTDPVKFEQLHSNRVNK